VGLAQFDHASGSLGTKYTLMMALSRKNMGSEYSGLDDLAVR